MHKYPTWTFPGTLPNRGLESDFYFCSHITGTSFIAPAQLFSPSLTLLNFVYVFYVFLFVMFSVVTKHITILCVVSYFRNVLGKTAQRFKL